MPWSARLINVMEASISPADFDAVLFDMDGVVTRTAALHFAAWKKIFDEFLRSRATDGFAEFTQHDYLDYVDGKSREDGIKSFLKSRLIGLEQGNPDDQPGSNSITGLSRKKDAEFLHLMHTRG